jgi:hypothetical protein
LVRFDRMNPSLPGRPERPDAARRSGPLFTLSWAIPLVLYVALASRLVAAGVGYEYDEALYVESAVFLLHGDGGAPPFMHDAASWMSAFGRSWPLMIIPYVGTVKAFVALPLFAVFGVSAEAARFAGILLGGLGIVGLVVLIRREVSPIAGLFAGMVLAIHPSYLDLTVFDNGGVSVWMAAMGVGALALANYLRRPSALSAGLLGLAAGLGVWGRANVIWLLASAVLGALLAFGRRAVPPGAHFAAMIAGGVAGAIPLVVYEVASGFETLRFMANTRQALSVGLAARRLRDMAGVMISDDEQRAIWGGPPLRPWEIGVGAALLALTLIGIFLPPRSGEPEIARWRRALSITTLVLAAILIASRLNVSQHHLVAVSTLSVEVSRRSRRAVPLMAATGAGLAVLLLGWDARIVSGLERTGGGGVFSSGLGQVAAYLESSPVPPERLKILDWGFQNSLYVLSAGAVHGTELFWGATEAASTRGITWESEIRDGGSFLLFRTPSLPPSSAAQGFLKALGEYRGERRGRTFYDRPGAPLAEIIEIPGAR